MKLKKEDHSTDLIQKARSALDQGDREAARAYALSALEEKVQVEQAWLILASISEPDQALQYIENLSHQESLR